MIKINTQHPVAYQSLDHIDPKGTANDNTHYPWFVTKTQRIFGRKVKHLDLGCAGGGLVKDFLDMNHFSIGIEGSNYSLNSQRAEWKTIPLNLFTGDICEPFHFIDDESDNIIKFDIITAWEVMEHIPREKLSGLFHNIWSNLEPGGLFVCSIATFEDPGYHVTLEQKPWWVEKFIEAKLIPVEGVYEAGDYVRESSFYITAKKV